MNHCLIERGPYGPLFAVCLLLIVAEPAVAEPQTYEDAFMQQVVRFASLNRLKIERLNRDVHADCYIPLTVATTVRSDGTVDEVAVVESSTVPVVDRYFRYVIEQAAPYPPLAGYYDPAPEQITITREFRLDVRLWTDGTSSSRPCEPLKPAPPQPDNDEAEIDYLLRAVGNSDCTFIRNGKEHTAEEAEDHLRMKYRRGKRYAPTAETFIERLASKSSFSGSPYYIDCPNGDPMAAGEWLGSRLAGYREMARE